jgi:putative transposase
MQDETAFYSGKQVMAKADHYARLMKRLQHKGTRSATRCLRVMSGRERRLKQDANHRISRSIVDGHPQSLIGLEDLTNIRKRTKRTHGKKASKKQRRTNRHVSKWAFAELHSYVAYKVVSAHSMAIKVDAHYTSQACPQCGHVSSENRPNKGLLFVCQTCQFTLHADLVGARNITLRALLARQDWARMGVLSVGPESLDSDVSNAETKAACLQRYAELRWSSDTSPAFMRGVTDSNNQIVVSHLAPGISAPAHPGRRSHLCQSVPSRRYSPV